MIVGDVIGPKKRRLLVGCAALLALAIAWFSYFSESGLNLPVAITLLAAALYTLSIGISWYRPPVLIAFLGLLLNLNLVLDEPTYVQTESGLANVAANLAIAAGSGASRAAAQGALFAGALILLVVVLTQHRWAKAAAG
jgi:hypothetical protein